MYCDFSTPYNLVFEGQYAIPPPQYFSVGGVEALQNALFASHPSTLGPSYLNQVQVYPPVALQTSDDDLLKITILLNQQQAEATNEETNQVAEIASNLENCLPSTPIQMYREQLPGFSTISGEFASLQPPFLPQPFNAQKQPSPRLSIPQSSGVLPSLPSIPSHPNLPSVTRPSPARPQQPRIPIPSPEDISPCSSPTLSPKRNKKNYTKEFNLRFHELLNNNDNAFNEWHIYAQRHKGKCTIKRAPCIKVSRGFCGSYGREFTDLAKEEKYGALGTRTECGCMHKPQPLPSTTGPSKKQRQPARSAPYPQTLSPSTPVDLELPSSPAEPSSPLTKQAWISFLLQSAPILHEGFNTFMGGMQCAVCNAPRAFASRDEVIAYLMREPIPCTQGCCDGHMQLHQ